MTAINLAVRPQRLPSLRRVLRHDRFLAFFAGVLVVQGFHVLEHIIQLFQVFVFGIPDDQALGLLGEVLELQGTEEWLHLAFNGLYLAAIVLLAVGLIRRGTSFVPAKTIVLFLVGAAGTESWHFIEHMVIIKNVIAHHGCLPCPGILDARLGVSDTVLHFFYNLVTYAVACIPFVMVIRRRLRATTS